MTLEGVADPAGPARGNQGSPGCAGPSRPHPRGGAAPRPPRRVAQSQRPAHPTPADPRGCSAACGRPTPRWSTTTHTRSAPRRHPQPGGCAGGGSRRRATARAGSAQMHSSPPRSCPRPQRPAAHADQHRARQGPLNEATATTAWRARPASASEQPPRRPCPHRPAASPPPPPPQRRRREPITSHRGRHHRRLTPDRAPPNPRPHHRITPGRQVVDPARRERNRCNTTR